MSSKLKDFLVKRFGLKNKVNNGNSNEIMNEVNDNAASVVSSAEEEMDMSSSPTTDAKEKKSKKKKSKKSKKRKREEEEQEQEEENEREEKKPTYTELLMTKKRRSVGGGNSSSRYFVEEEEEEEGTMEENPYKFKSYMKVFGVINYANVCSTCGDPFHRTKYCPNQFCSICNGIGHVDMDCPHEHGDMTCDWCEGKGHTEDECSFRNFVVTGEEPSSTMADVICFSCGKHGHINCSKPKRTHASSGTSCFNCGRNDHDGMSCSALKFASSAAEASKRAIIFKPSRPHFRRRR